jgi:hypothetical protein
MERAQGPLHDRRADHFVLKRTSPALDVDDAERTVKALFGAKGKRLTCKTGS